MSGKECQLPLHRARARSYAPGVTEVSAYHVLIRDMPSDERPRERLRLRGPEALTNAELIAILLRTGQKGENVVTVAQRVLSQVEGLRGLGKVSFGELAGQKAMGSAKAAQILAAVELGKRVVGVMPDDRRTIRSSHDVFAMLYAEMALLEQETLKVVLLNARNEVLCTRDVCKGTATSVQVRVADLFREAVRDGCPSIIAVHNHPSGDPVPSAEDAVMTKMLIESGKMLGIEVLDHVVIGRRDYVSMRESKIVFTGEERTRP